MQFFFHSPVTSSLFGPNTLLSTLFSNTIQFDCQLPNYMASNRTKQYS
jgi:hypothetical protein